MKTLYQIDNKQQLRTWAIDVDDYIIVIEHGLANGKKIRTTEPIIMGKGGRTLTQQVNSRVESRINKQKLRGYRDTIREAKAYAGKNELNLYKPMLAQQFDKQKNVNTAGAILQRKLDGNRMLVTKQDGLIVCYTRNGKQIDTLGHIAEQMHWLQEGKTVDGEVYKHGMPLKDIRGAVAKKQASTAKLDYHIYDVVGDNTFKNRFESIINYTQAEAIQRPNIAIEPYWYVQSKVITGQLFNTVRQQGYEGLIMRLDNQGYESGKRSKSLLKIKYRYDAEYPVIDIELGKHGVAILIMRLPNGKTVRGTAPGTKLEKQYVGDHPDEFIGKLCTCSFAYITVFGIPYHLTCDSWSER